MPLESPVGRPGEAGRASSRLPQPSSGSSLLFDEPELHLRPLQVTWEMTTARDWKSTLVRASARMPRDPREFSTAEAFHLIEEVAEMHVPLLVLTGGDPLRRQDLFPVIEFASRRSVRTSLTLLPTPLLGAQVLADLKDSGLMRVAFWLHGSTPALHDAYWTVPRSYRRTLEAVEACHEAGLPVQINTILAKRNFHDFDSMIELLTRLDVALWNLIFMVPANMVPANMVPKNMDPKNQEQGAELLSAEEHEEVFGWLDAASRRVHFRIKTTEGQHYERYLLQQRVRESHGRMSDAEAFQVSPKGVNEGRGYVFVDHHGEVYPSRYLPLSAGNLTTQKLSEVYCDSPLFVSLRDSSRLKGKCGRCPARKVCGGSRARAYVMSGDLFAADPCCAYQPICQP